MKTMKEENAVSPVVGVMLMLVVTIIIAALVSTFAGGLGGEVQVTPTAVLGVNDYTLTYYNSSYYDKDDALQKSYTYDITNMSLKNRGGTTLSTAELSIVLNKDLLKKPTDLLI